MMLIEDIKQVLTGDENCRIKIACIESYFNVYEQILDKKENEIKQHENQRIKREA